MAAPAERGRAADIQTGIGDVLASIRRMIAEDGSPASPAPGEAPRLAVTAGQANGHPLGVLRLDAPVVSTEVPPGPAPAPLWRLAAHDTQDAARLRATALREAIRSRAAGDASMRPPVEPSRVAPVGAAALVAGEREDRAASQASGEAGALMVSTPDPAAFADRAVEAGNRPGDTEARLSCDAAEEDDISCAGAGGRPPSPSAGGSVALEEQSPAGAMTNAAPTEMTCETPASSAVVSIETPAPAGAPRDASDPGPMTLPVAMSGPEGFFAEMIRDVVRRELQGDGSGSTSQALRSMVLREVARVITGAPG